MKATTPLKTRLTLLAAFLTAGSAWAVPINVPADHGSIQGAINAAAPGDTIIIADGTYSPVATINVNKSLTITGQSEAGVIIDASSLGTGYGIKVEADNVTLENFTLLPPVVPASLGTSAGGGFPIHATFNHSTTPYQPLSNLALNEITIEDSNRTAFDIHGYDGVTLTNLTARNSAYGNGIQLTGCTNATATGCTVEGNAWGGIAVYCSKAAYLNRGSSSVSIDFATNSVSQPIYVEDEFGLTNTAITVGGSTYLIENDYSATGFMHMYTDGTQADAVAIAQGLNTKYGNTASTVRNTVVGAVVVLPGSSIQAAIDAASPGDTIEIAAGSYAEALSVSKPLTLSGPNAGIDAVTGTRSAEAEITGQMTVTADDVTVDGIALENPTGTVGIYAKRCSRLTVANCVIHDINSSGTGSASGVYILGDNGGTGSIPVSDVTITGNHIHAIGSLATTVSVKGIYFGDSNGISTVSNVLVAGNKVENVLTTRGAYGIMLNYGVYATGTADNVEILDNVVTNLEGLWVHAIGLETDTTNTVVTGNDLSDLRDNKSPSDAVGIFFEGNPSGDTVEVSRNILRSSMGWGVAIHPDDISTYGYTVDAGANYWDAADGPAGEAPGTGTPVAPSVATPSFYADEALTMLISAETWVDDDFDGNTPGFGLDHFDNIQDAIAHTLAGGTVNVAAGTYAETGQIVIDKDLTVTGAGIGATTVNPTANTGSSGDPRGWWLVQAGVSLNLSDLTLDGTGFNIYQGIRIKGGGAIERVAFTEMKHPGYSGVGIAAFGDLNLDVSDSTFDEMGRIGVLYFGAGITGSSFTGNTYTGKGDGDWIDYCLDISAGATVLAENNTISDCTGVASSDGSASAGILVTTYYGAGTTATIANNTISGCTSGVHVGYDGSDTSTVSIEDNNLSGNASGVVGTIPADATRNYWGAADGPSGEGPGTTGSAVGAGIAYSPWWADAAMTILAYDSGTFSDHTVGPGETLEIPETLTITGGTFLIDGGTVDAGEVDLDPGAVLDVVEGELSIGGSTFAGSFTFFNSFGSININGDLTITASAEGLMLISDVHVADGVTITVNGTLVIDGCVVDSDGTFDLVVNSGADFTMARTVFSSGTLTTSADDTSIYDNEFVGSTIEITAGTSGAEVYHNVDASGTFLTDNGTDTVTAVDSWGNIAAAASSENNLALALDISALGATRTVDADGNVYIQPGDALTASLEVSDLQARIAAVETLLGYNTDLLAAGTLALETDWNETLSQVVDHTTVIGKIDTAIGVNTTTTDPSGIDTDDTIATLVLTGEGTEGRTRFFQRVKLASDTFGGDTRLSTGGPSPAYLAPFTSNSTEIVLDGTAPVIAEASVDGVQDQASFGTVDVLDASPATPPNFTFRNGNPVILTFTATDTGGSDLDTADATNDLSLTADNGTTVLDASDYTVTAVDNAGVVTYTVTLDVPVTATTGTYDVTATVLDRSGNESALAALGSFAVANELLVNIELQGFSGGTREVTFLGTDAGGTVVDTWIRTVTFTGTTGSIGLEDADPSVVGLSAKTGQNLRSKVSVSFSGTGVAAADLTGADLLPGGDVTGDNVVNTLDYSVLRYYWSTADGTADIDGDGGVLTGDFNLLKANFYTAGDPE